MTSSRPLPTRPARSLYLRLVPPALFVLTLFLAGCGSDGPGPTVPGASGRPPLLIAFNSNRAPSPNGGYDIYFYDVAAGTKAYPPPNINTIYDESTLGLSSDGHWMAFNSSRLLTGSQAQLFLYNVRTAEISVPQSPLFFTGAQNPSLSGDGHYLVFHYQFAGGLFDLGVGMIDAFADTIVPLPHLNTPGTQQFDPSITSDGKFIVATTRRFGSSDVLYYSVDLDSVIDLPNINTGYTETGVSISGNGRYIAFHSNRPRADGTSGLFDVYVYDIQTQSLLPLPGANTTLSELNPVLSQDGRYVIYQSENDGAGDLRLYDIQARKLIPVPGLNDSYYYDRFPSVSAKP